MFIILIRNHFYGSEFNILNKLTRKIVLVKHKEFVELIHMDCFEGLYLHSVFFPQPCMTQLLFHSVNYCMTIKCLANFLYVQPYSTEMKLIHFNFFFHDFQ